VRPRISRGITDLLLPRSSWKLIFLVGKFLFKKKKKRRSFILSEKDEKKNNISSWSRSLSKLIRQFKPRTTNGHAPPHQQIKQAHSNWQSCCCPILVSFPALGQIDPQIPLPVCRSVNFFKFQPCDHTPPKKHKFNDFSYINNLNLISFLPEGPQKKRTLAKKKKHKNPPNKRKGP